MRCSTCPALDDSKPCFGESRGLCGKPELAYHIRAMTKAGNWKEPAIPAKLVAHIELCDFRTSSCGCLNKPAICRLSTQPVTMNCVRDCPIYPG
jgi:hypothetical protein